MNDHHHMQIALRLARRGLGTTFPNPAVGCVIVKHEQIIGLGVTAPGGRPHAEVTALAMAGREAEGATVYVTLEPCCHHGRGAPCSEALIAARVSRVVIAVKDHDRRVDGGGIEALKQAGIEVSEGLYRDEAISINKGFFSVIDQGRPTVTLKLATSMDGKIATNSGESKWITGPQSRQFGHMLRARHDAIMVGVNTVIIDNPELTCRIPGLESQSPTRIIIDTNLRTPADCQLISTHKDVPTWIVTTIEKPADFPDIPFIHALENKDGRIDLRHAISLLSTRGITRLMVEGGGELAASLLVADLIDEIYWLRAPIILGNDGIPAVGTMMLSQIQDAPRFKRQSMTMCGEDVVEHLIAALNH